MIRVDDIHFITADPHCFILQEKKVNENGKNKGEEYYAVLGYYPDIKDALKGLLKKEIRKYLAKADEVTLKEAIKEINQIEMRINTIKQDL